MVKAHITAQGYAQLVRGGSGGRVFTVDRFTNENTGNITTRRGSLRWCLERQEPRIIVFEKGGTYDIGSYSSSLVSKSNVTMIGLTPNGGGVTIKGSISLTNWDNIVFRYIRMRLGQGTTSRDTITFRSCTNGYFDHCSFSWGRDETIGAGGVINFSFNNCIISECLNTDDAPDTSTNTSFGCLFDGQKVNFYNCLWINNGYRNPRQSGNTALQTSGFPRYYDFTNCAVVNWSRAGFPASQGTEAGEPIAYWNIRNCLMVAGPATFYSSNWTTEVCMANILQHQFLVNRVKVYLNGNRGIFKDGTTFNYDTAPYRGLKLASVIPDRTSVQEYNDTLLDNPALIDGQDIYNIIRPAEDLMDYLFNNCGANYQQDAIDLRVLTEARDRVWTRKIFDAGVVQFGGVPQLLSNTVDYTTQRTGSHPIEETYGGLIDDETDVEGWITIAEGDTLVSTKGDGIPDAWKIANGLDPNEDYGIAGTIDTQPQLYNSATGYRWIEEYWFDTLGETAPVTPDPTYNLTVQSSNETFGTVSRSLSNPVTAGATVQLTATPVGTGAFQGWYLGSVNFANFITKDNPYDRVVNSDATIIASFPPEKPRKKWAKKREIF